ncbi:MAG: hypothetical protein ACI4RV_08125 [Eubacteriales bacterium]
MSVNVSFLIFLYYHSFDIVIPQSHGEFRSQSSKFRAWGTKRKKIYKGGVHAYYTTVALNLKVLFYQRFPNTNFCYGYSLLLLQLRVVIYDFFILQLSAKRILHFSKTINAAAEAFAAVQGCERLLHRKRQKGLYQNTPKK